MPALKNELIKLTHKKKYIVFLILAVLFMLIKSGGLMLIKKITSVDLSVHTATAYDMIPFTVEILVPIIVFLATCDLFSNEFQDDTMKSILSQPITRGKVLFVKSLAIFLLSFSFYMIMFLISLLQQLLFGIGLKNAAEALAAYAVDLIPLICLIGLAVFINLLIKTPSLSLLICIAVYAAMNYFNYFYPTVGHMLFTGYTEWHKLIIGTLVPLSSLLAKFGIIAGTALILYSLSYIIFARTDV